MKILWMSDSPTTPSGFGNVTRFVCGGLANRGHITSILGWQTQGQPTQWQNCTLYPGAFSTERLLNYLHQLQPDILVTLANACQLTHFNYSLINYLHMAGIPWVLYYPIDADMGENRLPSSWIRLLKTVDLPIAMSRYGQKVIQANSIEPAYIPLGIDTKVFQPPVDKKLAKQAFGYEGKFVILSDARNQPHKMIPRTLEIFRRFAADKDDVILHLHCDPDDPWVHSPEYDYDLQSDVAFLNLTDKVCITKDMSISRGLSLEQLAQVYQVADVHLLASWGEGIGLSILQAAATGVVPLASGYAASQELIGQHGDATRIQYVLIDEFGLRRGLIDIENAVSKLEMLYQDRELLAHKAQDARDFALSYDWEHILPQWEELLQHEVHIRRTSLRPSAKTSSIPDDLRSQENSSDLPSEELTADELVTELLQEVQLKRTLRIPVTLPLTKSMQRVPGYIYAASQCDIPSVLALRRIFPGLKVWSTTLLDFESLISNDKPLQVRVVPANHMVYIQHLSMSTLALDMASFDPTLPVEAAKLGVPCIGLAQQKEQGQLWPKLSLEKPDPLMAAKLGRQMLTDQGVATELCLKARQHLASALIPGNNRSEARG